MLGAQLGLTAPMTVTSANLTMRKNHGPFQFPKPLVQEVANHTGPLGPVQNRFLNKGALEVPRFDLSGPFVAFLRGSEQRGSKLDDVSSCERA